MTSHLFKVFLALNAVAMLSGCSGGFNGPGYDEGASFEEGQKATVLFRLNLGEIVSVTNLDTKAKYGLSEFAGVISVPAGNYMVSHQCRERPDTRVNTRVTLYPDYTLGATSSLYVEGQSGVDETGPCESRLTWENK